MVVRRFVMLMTAKQNPTDEDECYVYGPFHVTSINYHNELVKHPILIQPENGC